MKPHRPIAPGELLLEEIAARRIPGARGLAITLQEPLERVKRILAGEEAIDGDLAAKLAVMWGTSVNYWLNLERLYQRDLDSQQW